MSKEVIKRVKERGFVTEGDDVCIAVDAEMFKDLFDLMSVLIETEVQVMIKEDGLYVKQMDESHVALTVMFIPKSYFRTLRPGQKIQELRLPVRDLDAILTRLGHGDVVEFTVTAEGRLHIEIKGRRLRAFNIPLFEPEKLDRRTPRVPFTARVKTSMEGILMAIEDASKLISRTKKKKDIYTSAMVIMTTTPMGLHIESSDENRLYSAETTLTSGWDIMQFDGKLDQVVMLSVPYLVDMVRTISKITNMVQLELATDMPLHMIVELPFKGMTLEYWFAPRVKPTGEEEEAVPEKEVS